MLDEHHLPRRCEHIDSRVIKSNRLVKTLEYLNSCFRANIKYYNYKPHENTKTRLLFGEMNTRPYHINSEHHMKHKIGSKIQKKKKNITFL